jgi:membrane-bound lytic murein transglycosylase B
MLRLELNLKNTIIGSCVLAGFLNLVQYSNSLAQRQTAYFTPAWAQRVDATPAPAVGLASAQIAPTAPAPSASAASAPTPADPTPSAAQALSRAGLDPQYAGLYLWVQAKTGTPWQLLAAVHAVETGQSGSTTRTSGAGATGPMQFMPSTFARYAMDGNGDGIKDVHNLQDSMLTAGRYLAASGAAAGRYQDALYNYNHSWSYVSRVSGIAGRLGL